MIFALLLVAPIPNGEVVVRLRGPAEKCQVEVGDRWFEAMPEDLELDRALRTLPAKKPVRIISDTSLPYRCIGGLIYRLQRLGHTRVAFAVAE